MKTLLTTLNAKYIHTSLALRWLYVASKDSHDIDFKEYTIKDDVEYIANDILNQGIDILGIGVYIWNVRQIKELVTILKTKNPNLIIILGGPEVSYETEFFLNTWNIDYIISGEAEFVLEELIGNIKNRDDVKSPHVAYANNLISQPAVANIEKLEKLDSPYQLDRDKNLIPTKISYFESSRGCPYMCQYCLSSLEGNVRYFSTNYIDSQLTYLFNNGSKTVKFLDRTFNLNRKHTLFVFDLIKKLHNSKTVCQFEIYADIMPSEMIDYINTFPKDFIRFEIGIQSTYEETNKAVKRIQNFDKIRENVDRLHEGGVVDLHLDLIAGLPYETCERFKDSFNEVFSLRAKEVQLGFLKLLRGTNLRKQAEIYGYLYDLEGPYEIYQNNSLSVEDVSRIKIVEDMLEKYWNSGRFKGTMDIIFSKEENKDYFEWFYQLGLFYAKQGIPRIGHHLDQIYRALHDFIKPEGILLKTLLLDYYGQFKIRPKRFIEPTLETKEKKQFIRLLLKDNLFMSKNDLDPSILYKYTYYEKINENQYLLIQYKDNNSKFIEYNINQL